MVETQTLTKHRPTSVEITIVALEFAGLYFIQVSYKAFVYSAKLKCEIGILNRLVDFVKTAAGPYRQMHRHQWPHHPHDDAHKCHVHGCEDVANRRGGDGARGNGEDRDFELSSQIEREWETTLRNTFGVVLGEGGGGGARDNDEKRDDGGELLSRRISASTAREQQQQHHQQQQQLKPSFEDLGHPGERVLGLFTIASGDGSRVRNSVEEAAAEGTTESSSNAALWSASWEPQRSTPPLPERSHLR